MKGLKAILAWLLLCIIWACNTEDEQQQFIEDDFIVASALNFVLEENPPNGRMIGTIPSIEDASDVTYSLLNIDPFGALELDSESGEIRVKDSTFFNFELYPTIKATGIASTGSTTIHRPINIDLTDVFEEYSYIGTITLRSNLQIEQFASQNHWGVSGALIIEGALNLEPLATLERVGSLYLWNINTQSPGLHNIRHIRYDLRIEDNNTWEDLSGLGLNIDYLGRDLLISDNQNLTSLEGLSLQEVGRDITIRRNNQLPHLTGINLQSVGGDLDINHNPSMIGLSGLESLTQVSGDLTLSTLSSLSNIASLSSLNNINGSLNIINNGLLSDFCSLTDLLTTGGLQGDYLIEANAYNPTLQQMLDGQCSN